jgi:hypothetical protein
MCLKSSRWSNNCVLYGTYRNKVAASLFAVEQSHLILPVGKIKAEENSNLLNDLLLFFIGL